MIVVEIGSFPNILLFERHFVGLTLHKMGTNDICGRCSQTSVGSSSGEGLSVRKFHYGFLTSTKTRLVSGSQPSLALTFVSGKMNLHAFCNAMLNQPIIRVGFPRIFASTTSDILVTTPSKLIAHLWPWQSCELKLNRNS
nr:hypothetical protein CFP56_17649 [Quercus suber]